jgi:anti-sigma regulatory factor (Ser/Thr protein kinase)
MPFHSRNYRRRVSIMETKTVSFWVPGGTRAAGLARRSILSVEAGLPDAVRHRLALLLSELVTNAIQHGGAGEHETIQVRIASSYEKIRVEVFDPGPNAPGPRSRLEPQGGYGLLLVDRLAHGWGRDRVEGGGSLAWFELQLDPTDHI